MAEKLIVLGLPYELVYDYLEWVESGAYLSKRGCKILEKYLMEQDLERCDEMFEEYDENYDLSNILGDEGVWNLDNAMGWQNHG